jgi:putative protease
VKLDFTPDPLKTFNRSYTDYGLHSNNGKYGSIDTPKSLGEPVGSISNVSGNYFELQESDSELHNGDGICFFDGGNSLQGTVINKVEGGRIYPQKMEYLQPGILIYRNYDHLFTKKLENTAAGRKIGLSLIFTETPDGVKLTGIDEDGNTASIETPAQKEPAKNPELAHNNIKKQLGKLGETIFESTDIKIELERAYFFTAAFLNSLRRELADKMLRARLKARSIPHRAKAANPGASYPEKELTFMGNVLNEKARDFYLARGVEKIEPAAESGIDIRGRQVMTTKYCLRRQIGLCEGAGKDTTVPPLYITDDYNNSYKLTFTCRDCGMKIFLRDKG